MSEAVLETSETIAEQILARFKESEGDGITTLKLQKLIYYILGWTLAIEKRLLFIDPVEAQPFGPAFPIVREKYRNDEVFKNAIFNTVPIESNPLIDAVVDVYGAQKPNVLVARTHREDPWMDNYCEDNLDIPAIIPTEHIKKYFLGQLTDGTVKLHTMFLRSYMEKKFQIVSVRIPAMSDDELQAVRNEVGLA